MATDPLLRIAEELYGLPPGDFTGTRNAWAKQTRAEGDTDLAAQVAGLRRPALSAWVVNMMVRHQAEQMTQVLELGASLRQAQADLDPEALRELTRQRRQLTAAVTHQGRVLAGELGHKVTEAVAEQVQGTLHAAMVDEQAAAAVRSGLLVGPLASTGVGPTDVGDAVAVPAAIGLVARTRSRPAARPVGRRPELSVVRDGDGDRGRDRDRAHTEGDGSSDERAGRLAREEAERAQRLEEQRQQAHERAREQAQEAVEAASDRVDDAEQRLRKARKRVSRVQARTLQAADELDQARRRVAELEHELEGLDEESAAAEGKQQRAEQRHAEAEQVLESARADLEELADLEGPADLEGQ